MDGVVPVGKVLYIQHGAFANDALPNATSRPFTSVTPNACTVPRASQMSVTCSFAGLGDPYLKKTSNKRRSINAYSLVSVPSCFSFSSIPFTMPAFLPAMPTGS